LIYHCIAKSKTLMAAYNMAACTPRLFKHPLHDGDHPYAGKWWVPGLCLGYEHSFVHTLHEFLVSLDSPKAAKRYADFRDALGTQYVCDAVLEAARTHQLVRVKRV